MQDALCNRISFTIFYKKSQSFYRLQKYTFIFLCCSLLFAEQSFSQSVPAFPQPIPPSPNAASLGKYGDMPVSKYTGIPDINIPLYQITEGDIQVPISLSYHSSGIKVEENASWVGLGWSLNAGGVITRSVRGIADESGYLLNSVSYTSITDGTVKNNLIPNLLLDPEKFGQAASFCDVENACEYAKLIRDRTVDSEPDIYYFNFNGISGKFVLDQNGKAYVMPYQKINIQRIDNYKWVITTSEGNKYTFSTGELTTPLNLSYLQYGGSTDDNSGNRTSPAFVSSWYLSKIESPTGHQVTFDYDLENSDIISGTSQSLVWTDIATSIGLSHPVLSNTGAEYLINGFRLKQINFSNGSINFVANTPRADMNILAAPTPNLLEKIVINNLSGPIKQFVLNTDYFISADVIKSYQNKRLRLNSVTEWNGDLTVGKPPYQFVYDNSHLLPSKISTSQDHWGFYNGKMNTDSNNFPTLIPDVSNGFFSTVHEVYKQWSDLSTPILDNNYPYYTQIVYKGADRSPDFNYSKAGILNKIIYPTGGYTSFEYEPNDYKLDSADYAHTSQEYLYISNSTNDNNINQGSWTTVVDDGLKCTHTEIINPSQYITADNSNINKTIQLDLNLSFINGNLNSSGSVTDTYCCGFNLPEAILKDVTTNKKLLDITGRAGVPQIIDQSIKDQINAGQVHMDGDFTNPDVIGGGFHWNNAPNFNFTGLQLDPTHTYALISIAYHNQPGLCDSRTSCPQPAGEIFTPALARAKLYIKSNGVTQYNGTLGGLRVKKIADYSNASSPIIKNYTYRLLANSNISSGVISDVPVYTDRHRLSVTLGDVAGPNSGIKGQPTGVPGLLWTLTKDELVFTSGSKFELGQTSGSFVGYKEVQESYCQDGSCAGYPLGKKIYTYTTSADYPDVNSNIYGYVFWGNISSPCSNTDNSGYRFDLRWMTSTSIEQDAYRYPYPPKNNFDWKRGLLLSEVTYDQNGILKKKIVSNYNLVNDKTNQKVISGIKLSSILGTEKNHMYYGRYDYIVGWNYKNQEITTDYDINGANPIITTANYFYDNPDHALLTRTETTNSKGETVQEKNRYVGDESSITNLTATELDAITKLKNQFHFSALLEKEVNKNNNLISKTRTGYRDWGNNLIMPETIKTQVGNNLMEPRLSYQSYDNSNGNILQAAPVSGSSTTYLWGYHKEYPIAEIKNASYASIISALTKANINIDNLGNQPTVSAADLTNIRAVINSALPDAQITTYSYQPLMGMTSMTDAKGIVTYYEYDSSSRLMNIKDQDGNIIKHIDYHYQSN